MVTKHLTDGEIQLFAFDKENYELKIAEHINICPTCKAKFETYRLLIKGIKQPRAAFDFDLSASVLENLQKQAPKTANDKLLIWIFIFICAGLIGAVSWYFRNILVTMFKGLAGIAIYLIAISAITVIALMFVEMYKKYQKEMKVLDLY
jgi:hypothetical protein